MQILSYQANARQINTLRTSTSRGSVRPHRYFPQRYLSPDQLQVDSSTSGGMRHDGAAESDASKKWLISPLFDLMFVAGAAPWILGGVALLVVGQDLDKIAPSPMQNLLSIFFVLASLLIGESHQFTSIIRYYRGGKERQNKYKWQRLPFWFIYTTVVLGLIDLGFQALGARFDQFPVNFLTGILTFLGSIFQLAMMFFPVVLMQHFCGQAQAIGMMYCGRQGYKLNNHQKRNVTITSWLLVLSGATTIAAPFGTNAATALGVPPLIGMSSPLPDIGWLFVSVAAAAVLYNVASFIRRGLEKNEWLPAGAAYLWINLSLLILLPFPGMNYIWLFAPIFLHATQHWTIAWLAQKQEYAKQGRQPEQSAKQVFGDICRLTLPIQALTLFVLFMPLLFAHMFHQSVNGVASTLSVGFSMFVFYLHYFADRVVWRP